MLVASASAQPPNSPPIAPNKLVEALERVGPGTDGIVEIKGYVASSSGETVRVYTDLSLTTFIDIPKEAILHSIQDGDPAATPLRLFVRGSSTLVMGTRFKADRLMAANASKAARSNPPLSIRQQLSNSRNPAGSREAASNDLSCLLLFLACAEGNVGACYLYVMYCNIHLPPVTE